MWPKGSRVTICKQKQQHQQHYTTHLHNFPSDLLSSALCKCGYWSASFRLAACAHTMKAFIGLFTWSFCLIEELCLVVVVTNVQSYPLSTLATASQIDEANLAGLSTLNDFLLLSSFSSDLSISSHIIITLVNDLKAPDKFRAYKFGEKEDNQSKSNPKIGKNVRQIDTKWAKELKIKKNKRNKKVWFLFVSQNDPLFWNQLWSDWRVNWKVSSG